MASIVREFEVAAPAEFVWQAIRDLGAAHTRLARGFVTDTRLEAGARVVTFANGLTARELIIDVSDERRRFAYSIVAGRATHHNASFEVQASASGTTASVRWVTDVLPHELGEPFARMVDAGVAAMKHTVEADFTAGALAPATSSSR
jgi:hypothetical protein